MLQQNVSRLGHERLGCDVMQFFRQLSTFPRKLLPSSSGRRNFNGRRTFLWNVGIYEPHYTAPHPRRPINPLTPNDPCSGRTAPLNSKRCNSYIYSTNTGTEYFKHGIYSPFFSLQNAVCFIILTYLVPVLFTFYIQSVLKFKKIIPAPKG